MLRTAHKCLATIQPTTKFTSLGIIEPAAYKVIATTRVHKKQKKKKSSGRRMMSDSIFIDIIFGSRIHNTGFVSYLASFLDYASYI
jgi:hypothetical protein